MRINPQNDQEIFAVAVDDLQNEAAKKCVESGLSSCIDITLRAAIDEAAK